jgi:4-hydroxybenzoate polyprenyltransferase
MALIVFLMMIATAVTWFVQPKLLWIPIALMVITQLYAVELEFKRWRNRG